MSAGSAHPERLLLALDEALDHGVSLIIYGRSVIWLFSQMKPIELVELRDAFAKAKPIILRLAREVSDQ